MEFVLDAMLLENFRQILRAVEGQRVFLSATDRQQLDLLVGLISVVEQGRRAFLEIGGRLRVDACAPNGDVGELMGWEITL